MDFAEKLWNAEKYSGGCPVTTVISPGVMKDFGRAVREPFLNTHFCGTDTAVIWQGYMDGAVESGERAANEILYKLYNGDNSVKVDFEKTYYYQSQKTT